MLKKIFKEDMIRYGYAVLSSFDTVRWQPTLLLLEEYILFWRAFHEVYLQTLQKTCLYKFRVQLRCVGFEVREKVQHEIVLSGN